MKQLLFITLLLISTTVQSQNIDKIQLLSDIKTLSSEKFEGRRTGTAGNKMAADFIAGRFDELGMKSYQDSFKHPFVFKNRAEESKKGTNLIAYIKGKSKKTIVISAHYDHLGSNGPVTYFGADDNASGVAAMLSFAEYFKNNRPKHTLLFVAFDAEESGLRGAVELVNKPPVRKKYIVLNVNMDMISHNDKKELYASGTFKNPHLKTIIEGADEDTGIKILFGHDLPGSGLDDWTMQSDQGAFAKENIPFIYFGVEDHKDYHKPTDMFENINQDFYYGASTAILRSIVKIDKQLE
ncbi:MAG: M28 family peptidase [Daejeonella sp.]|uniref:M28 family peptidase n=1 Tax=Daejeonella sp. TaxID=2805397 RepID=UPI003C744E07